VQQHLGGEGLMPTLTPEERHEAYLLLRYFRITWHERQQVYEAWEIENALAFLRAELGVPDTFDDAEPDAKTVEADEGEQKFNPGSWAVPPDLPML
jgi:hypothetical protein